MTESESTMMPSPGAGGLEVSGLTITAGGATLVDDASFRLRPGELVALLGPNGAGKTTLLRGAIGLAPPGAGWARIDGEDAAGMPPRHRARRLAYLPQNRPLAWPNPVRDGRGARPLLLRGGARPPARRRPRRGGAGARLLRPSPKWPRDRPPPCPAANWPACTAPAPLPPRRRS